MEKTVLILGSSGKIGRACQEAFAKAGWQVRSYDRQAGDMVRQAQGVDVIVNGLNPPKYHDWDRLIPAITNQVIDAARSSGATVIIPGNVYNLDDQGGQWSELTPHRPPSRKGKIRETMERAYQDSGVQTIILRAGNFIDPQGIDDVMSMVLLRSLRGGSITAAGKPDAQQAYCYVPDWAEAAVGLAEKRHELARFEDVPFAGHSFSVEQFREDVQQLLGRPLRIQQLPWWVFRGLAPFWELAREMLEMRYLWSTSHSLSGAKLSQLLPGFRPTEWRVVLRQAVQVALPEASLAPAPSLGERSWQRG